MHLTYMRSCLGIDKPNGEKVNVAVDGDVEMEDSGSSDSESSSSYEGEHERVLEREGAHGRDHKHDHADNHDREQVRVNGPAETLLEDDMPQNERMRRGPPPGASSPAHDIGDPTKSNNALVNGVLGEKSGSRSPSPHASSPIREDGSEARLESHS